MVDVSLVYLIVPLVLGVLCGYVLRGTKRRVNLDRVTVAVIVVLIFALGFSISSNDALLGSLPRVGFNALVIALVTVAFSVALVKAARRWVRF